MGRTLTTDLYEHDCSAILEVGVWDDGIKDGSVDHAVRARNTWTRGTSSVFISTGQFGGGLTEITLLEQLDIDAAEVIAATLRRELADGTCPAIDLQFFAETVVDEWATDFMASMERPPLEFQLAEVDRILEVWRRANAERT